MPEGWRDEALAAKYLTTAAQYLEMYRGLIGPYPYGKFALVENFWETGYGMPSFTLVRPRPGFFPSNWRCRKLTWVVSRSPSMPWA